jgi:hypothetical protein
VVVVVVVLVLVVALVVVVELEFASVGVGEAVTAEDDVTTAVGPEVATADPFLFVAVTVTLNVCPTSPELTTLVWLVAEAMPVQAEPELSHRCH